MKPLSEQEIREKIATILDRWGLNPDPDYGLPEELLQFILQDRQAWVEQAVH